MEAGVTSRSAKVALAVLVLSYAFMDLVAAAPDSPLTPNLPAGAGSARWARRAAQWVRLDGLTRTQLTLASILVIALSLCALGIVLAEAWHGRVRLGSVLFAVGASIALAVLAPVLLSRDVYSYAAYGRIFALHEANPYVVPPAAFPADPFVGVASPEWLQTPSVYGPAFTLLSAALTKAWSGSTGATLAAFKIAAGLSLGLASLLAARVARAIRPGKEALAAAAIGLNPVLVLHTVGGAHNDALVALLVMAALAVAVSIERGDARGDGESRAGIPSFVAVTALLTAAFLVKTVAAPLLILWLWRVNGRATARGSRSPLLFHLLTVVAVAGAAFAPFVAGMRTARALLAVASRQGWASGPGMVVRGARALGRAGGGSVGGVALEVLVSAVFAGLFLVFFWRTLRGSAGDADIANGWGTSMLLFALAAPYLLPWYAAWFLPLVVLVEDRALMVVGLVAAAILALTGVPAEPNRAPQLWDNMVLGVHYGAAALMLALLAAAVARTIAGRAEAVRFRPPGQ